MASKVEVRGGLGASEADPPLIYPPKSVLACQDDRWCIVLTGLDGLGELTIRPFRCHSWRCTRCRWGRNQDDANLIHDVIEGNGGRDLWLYTVLTFDQRAFSGGRYDAFAAIYDQFRKLTKRLRRRFGTVEWICTIEQHGSGWPHLNVLFHSPGMVERHYEAAYRLRDDIRSQAVAVGFGPIVMQVGPIKDVAAVSGYIVKSADSSTRIGGEMSKLSQLPITAPPRFRRLRLSRGLERPPKPEKKYTGELQKVSAHEGLERLESLPETDSTNCALKLLLSNCPEVVSITPSARHRVAGGVIVNTGTGEILFTPGDSGPGGRGRAPVLSEGRLKGRCT